MDVYYVKIIIYISKMNTTPERRPKVPKQNAPLRRKKCNCEINGCGKDAHRAPTPIVSPIILPEEEEWYLEQDTDLWDDEIDPEEQLEPYNGEPQVKRRRIEK